MRRTWSSAGRPRNRNPTFLRRIGKAAQRASTSVAPLCFRVSRRDSRPAEKAHGGFRGRRDTQIPENGESPRYVRAFRNSFDRFVLLRSQRFPQSFNRRRSVESSGGETSAGRKVHRPSPLDLKRRAAKSAGESPTIERRIREDGRGGGFRRPDLRPNRKRSHRTTLPEARPRGLGRPT